MLQPKHLYRKAEEQGAEKSVILPSHISEIINEFQRSVTELNLLPKLIGHEKEKVLLDYIKAKRKLRYIIKGIL